MKGLRNFLCRHPYLAIILPLIPCVGLAIGLVAFRILTPYVALVCLAWLFLFISFPVRRIPRAVMQDAAIALERDLDPDAYLSGLALLRARHPKNPVAQISLAANYAAGLDAKGKSEEALTYLKNLRESRARLDKINAVQFDLSYAVVAVHTTGGRADIPVILDSVRAAIPLLPPSLAAAAQETAESVRMAYGLYTGNLEEATLINYYVGVISRYRAEGAMSRRRLIRACMNLALVYSRAGRTTDAAVMYRYVAENGGGLGLVQDARRALASANVASQEPDEGPSAAE